MTNIRRIVFLNTLMSLALLLVVACTSLLDSPENGNSSLVVTLTPESESVGSDNDVVALFLPQQKNMDGERETMTAELIGKLVMEDACLRIEEPNSETSYLPIWAPEFRLELSANDSIQIYGSDGSLISIGQTVYLDGGEMLSVKGVGVIEDDLQDEIQQKCTGPYWLVGNTLRLAESEN